MNIGCWSSPSPRSSHNTYLLSWQVLGRSSAEVYSHVLSRNARCVEVDVWSSSNGPVVTHGYTLSKSVPFLAVCKAISDAVSDGTSRNDWPVFVSLECHVPVEKQDEIVDIMKSVWGEKLLTGARARAENLPPLHAATPRDLRGRIILMVRMLQATHHFQAFPHNRSQVEYYPAILCNSDSEPKARGRCNSGPSTRITESLAELGFYARSMKPSKGWEHTGDVPCQSFDMPSAEVLGLPHQISLVHHTRQT